MSDIWKELGAAPVVMNFTEIFTALETGIIDGADASNLVNNVGLGLYDIVNYTTYPGFHSMPADHLACNNEAWDKIPAAYQRDITRALSEMAADLAEEFVRKNEAAARDLRARGVETNDWSKADRKTFRETAIKVFEGYVRSSTIGTRILDSQRRYMTSIGLLG